MTELSGNKRRVHTRHEAHGSVCVSAFVLPAGANLNLAPSILPAFDIGVVVQLIR